MKSVGGVKGWEKNKFKNFWKTDNFYSVTFCCCRCWGQCHMALIFGTQPGPLAAQASPSPQSHSPSPSITFFQLRYSWHTTLYVSDVQRKYSILVYILKRSPYLEKWHCSFCDFCVAVVVVDESVFLLTKEDIEWLMLRLYFLQSASQWDAYPQLWSLKEDTPLLS